jgi:hypothetical protein
MPSRLKHQRFPEWFEGRFKVFDGFPGEIVGIILLGYQVTDVDSELLGI